MSFNLEIKVLNLLKVLKCFNWQLLQEKTLINMIGENRLEQIACLMFGDWVVYFLSY